MTIFDQARQYVEERTRLLKALDEKYRFHYNENEWGCPRSVDRDGKLVIWYEGWNDEWKDINENFWRP